jgi:hydrogenase 3 maturation protease
MSTPSWPSWLERTLRKRRCPDGPARVAVVGIGHELRGDDAAGVAVARALQARLRDQRTRGKRPASRALQPMVLVIDGGPAPENHTATLRRFAPDVVLLVDAAQMGVRPGTVRRLRQEAASGVTASTHTLPVSVLASYLVRELGCRVALLGIQPASNAIGDPISPPVANAVDQVTRRLLDLLSGGARAVRPAARPRRCERPPAPHRRAAAPLRGGESTAARRG